MTSTGVIKAQQQENPNFPHRLPYPPCDQLIPRRAGLDEVKPAKYLCEFRGRMALLDHSSLSNLILHFAVRVPLCPWCGRVPHWSLTTGVTQHQGSVKVNSRFYLSRRPELLPWHRSPLTSTASVPGWCTKFRSDSQWHQSILQHF